ncbi:MAG: histidine phosphatase family protein [Chloroflexi bacterium]|nr:histidine phosphatase family protein [Chloroflexota bacterium]
MTVKRVILVRPGETDWNMRGRWQGWVAVPLNEHGRKQAQHLARFLRNAGIKVLYSSDLRRARETAAILAEKLGFAPEFDERLRERHIGTWQGLTPDEMRAWYPDEYRQLVEDRAGYIVPNGESRNQVKQRMISAFNDYLRRDEGETIAILSHSSAIRTLLSQWVDEAKLVSTDVDNTSVTTIVRDENDDTLWHIVAMNDVTHLEELESRSIGEFDDPRHR